MNIQKIKLFKNKYTITKLIVDLCNERPNLREISIIAIPENPSKIYIICSQEAKTKYFGNRNEIDLFTAHCNTCKCYIETTKQFEKELVYNSDKYWLIIQNCLVLFDATKRIKKIVKTANKRRNWWSIFKKIFYW